MKYSKPYVIQGEEKGKTVYVSEIEAGKAITTMDEADALKFDDKDEANATLGKLSATKGWSTSKLREK